MESGILGFEIHNTAQGNRNGTNHMEFGIQVPLTKKPKSRIQNPRLSWIPLREVNNYLVFLKNHGSDAGEKEQLGQGKLLSPQRPYHQFTLREKSFES